MKLSKNTIAAALAAMLIGGLSIMPASAAVRDNGQSDQSLSQQKVIGCAKSPRKIGCTEKSGDWITAQLLLWGF